MSAIRLAADNERDAFGFLPARAYDDFAARGRMLVAIDDQRMLIGYLLFGGVLPQARVFQVWCAPEAWGSGVARCLIDRMIELLEANGYLSIRADVASDLSYANNFYAGQGFDVLCLKEGSRSRGRTINVRVRELSTPSLLDFTGNQSGLRSLSLRAPTAGNTPLYVIDLNVIFDVIQRRTRARTASLVMAAAFENEIRLAVTTELINELQRNNLGRADDPVLQFALTLPRLPAPRQIIDTELNTILGIIVLPNQVRDHRLSVQDSSDLAHLATAIQECAAGFITSEIAILRVADKIRNLYNLDVISPETFSPRPGIPDSLRKPLRSAQGSTSLEVIPAAEDDYDEIKSLLRQYHATTSQINKVLARGTDSLPRRRLAVRVNSQLSAVASWDAPQKGSIKRSVEIWVDETNDSRMLAVECLIDRMLRDAGAYRSSAFELCVPPNQPTVRQSAIRKGFFLPSSYGARSRILQEVSLGQAVTASQWEAISSSMFDAWGLSLGSLPASYAASANIVTLSDIGGVIASATVAEIETLLSPALLLLPNRPSVILPIRHQYAEELFEGSAQPSFLDKREARLRTTKAYAGSMNTHALIHDGGVAVFYEPLKGGGRGAAIAMARIGQRYLLDKTSASRAMAHKGVLDPTIIEGMGAHAQVCISEFDNVMRFRTPVPLSTLRAIGCADGANFVTARAISSEHLVKIAEFGQPHE